MLIAEPYNKIKILVCRGSRENSSFSVGLLFCFLRVGFISPLTYLRTAFVSFLSWSSQPSALKLGSEAPGTEHAAAAALPSACLSPAVPPRQSGHYAR